MDRTPLAPIPGPAAPAPKRRRLLEAMARTLLVLGIVVAPLAVVAAAVAPSLAIQESTLGMARSSLVLAPLLLGAAVALAHPLDRVGRGRVEANPTVAAGLWTRLKVGGLLLNLFALLTAVLLAFALLVRVGIFQAPVGGDGVQRAVLALVGVFAVAHGYTLHAILRVGLPRERSGIRAIVMVASLIAAALLAAVALVLAAGAGEELSGTVPLDVGDLPFVVLGAQGAAALALVASRSLPGALGLLQQGRLGQAVATTGRRGVFLPVFAAFALLFLVFLIFILFGVGVTSLAQTVAENPVLLGVMVLLVLAFLASIIGAMSLARQESAEQPLYRKPRDAKRRRELWILGASLGSAALIVAPAVLLFQGYEFPTLGLAPQHWIHFVCIGVLVAIGPYGFYQAREHRRIRLLEERFPDFLRDIASSHKGGLTLTQAAVIASRGEYGPLTPEVKKMSDQLRWNVSFNEALQRFSDRVQTPLVQRAVSLILQANKSGGATTEVLLAAARDAREIKTLENERKVSMSLYTVVIYVTFFVFLGVAAVMYSQFIPQLVESSRAAADQAASLGGTGIEGLGSGGELRLEDFQLFYFLAAVVQGLGDGIVAGLMGQGKAVLGLRHSFVMVLLSYITFTFLLA